MSDARADNPRFDAEQIGLKVLALLKDAASIADFTPERIHAVTGLTMQPAADGADRFGYGQMLTPRWSYGIGVNRATPAGATFDFSFDPQGGASPAAIDEVCAIDFARFSSELERMGFDHHPIRGEHDRVVFHQFQRAGLTVRVATQLTAAANDGAPARTCVRSLSAQ